MQVYAVLSHHVMFIARISEEIRLGTRVDAGTQERQGVLRDAHRVVVTDDDLEFAFQGTGFESQVTAFVAFGIVLRTVHITLAVHHFVVLPIDDRTSGHTGLEYVGISQHEVGGHETAERPSVHTHPVGIDVGQ